jgi:hypothetical protein
MADHKKVRKLTKGNGVSLRSRGGPSVVEDGKTTTRTDPDRATYTIDYDPSTWRRLKALAGLRGLTMRALLHQATDDLLKGAKELR